MNSIPLPRSAHEYRRLGCYLVYDQAAVAYLTDGTRKRVLMLPSREPQAYIDGLTEYECGELLAGRGTLPDEEEEHDAVVSEAPAGSEATPSETAVEPPPTPSKPDKKSRLKTAVPELPEGKKTAGTASKRPDVFTLSVDQMLPPELYAQLEAAENAKRAAGEPVPQDTGKILYKASWCSTGTFDYKKFKDGKGFDGQVRTYIVQGSSSFVVTYVWNREKGQVEQLGNKVEQIASVPLYPEKLVRVFPSSDPPSSEAARAAVNFRVAWAIAGRADGSTVIQEMPQALAGMDSKQIRHAAKAKEFPNDPRAAKTLYELTDNKPGIRIPTLADWRWPSEAFDGRCEPLPIENKWSEAGWAINPDDLFGEPVHVWLGSERYSPPSEEADANPIAYVEKAGGYTQQRTALAELVRLSERNLALVPLGVAAGSFLLGLPYLANDPTEPPCNGRHVPSFGGFFHFVGPPQEGKSFSAQMACSMVGPPRPSISNHALSLFNSADGSKAGVELLASNLRHGFFVLDEVQSLMTAGRVDDLAAHLMSIINGGNRAVIGRGQALRKSRASLALLMTTGNIGWISMANQGKRAAANRDFFDALMTRGIEWDIRRHPIFPLHPEGSAERAAVAKAMDFGMGTLVANYGHIYPLITASFAKRRTALVSKKGKLNELADRHRTSTHPAIRRLAEMLAATEIGMDTVGQILGLQRQEIDEAKAAFHQTLVAIEQEMKEQRAEKVSIEEAFLSWVFSQPGRLYVQGHLPSEYASTAEQQKEHARAHNEELRRRGSVLGVIRQRTALLSGTWNDELVLHRSVEMEYDRHMGATGAARAAIDALYERGWLRASMKKKEKPDGTKEIKMDSPTNNPGPIYDDQAAGNAQLWAGGRGFIIKLAGWAAANAAQTSGNDDPEGGGGSTPSSGDASPDEPEETGPLELTPLPPTVSVEVVGEDACGFPVFAETAAPAASAEEPEPAPATPETKADGMPGPFVAGLKQMRDLRRAHGPDLADAVLSGEVPLDERGEFDANAFFGPRGGGR